MLSVMAVSFGVFAANSGWCLPPELIPFQPIIVPQIQQQPATLQIQQWTALQPALRPALQPVQRPVVARAANQ